MAPRRKAGWTAEKEKKELQLRYSSYIASKLAEDETVVRERIRSEGIGNIAACGSRMTQLGTDVCSVGCRKVLEANHSGWMDLSKGLEYLCWGNRINLRLSSIPGRMKAYRLDACLVFGLAFAFGFDQHARFLAEKLLLSPIPDDEQFDRQSDWSPFVPLMMKLAALWVGVEFDESRIKGAYCHDGRGKSWWEKIPCAAYEGIWTHWDDAAALAEDLNGACDYHIANGLTVREKDSMEFYSGLYSAVAMEVLSVLRLRRELGLSVPVVEHPFLQTPLHSPPLPLPDVQDDLLQEVVTKVRSLWPDI